MTSFKSRNVCANQPQKGIPFHHDACVSPRLFLPPRPNRGPFSCWSRWLSLLREKPGIGYFCKRTWCFLISRKPVTGLNKKSPAPGRGTSWRFRLACRESCGRPEALGGDLSLAQDLSRARIFIYSRTITKPIATNGMIISLLRTCNSTRAACPAWKASIATFLPLATSVSKSSCEKV